MNHLALLLSIYLTLLNSDSNDYGSTERAWRSFSIEHGKSNYNKLIKSNFARNKKEIDRFNVELSEEAGFSLELNHLADRGESDSQIHGFKLPADYETRHKNSPEAEEFLSSIFDDDSIEVPDEVDWRKVPGRVSRVKNQGYCGSCWAFASTGVLEGQEMVRRRSLKSKSRNGTALVELSEQNLVDCVNIDYGCNGGYMKDALEFVKQEGGIDDEKSYPYEARTKKCRFNKDKVAFSDSGAAILPTGDEQKLKEVVAKFGPVAVAIDANSFWFQFYRKGVYYNKHCKNKVDQLDHGVLVVGYGTDPKKGDYWIVKNSWGPKYGEQGYIRMARNRDNNCGIATVATIPII